MRRKDNGQANLFNDHDDCDKTMALASFIEQIASKQ